MHIGAHISKMRGLNHIIDTAISIGADTFQFFLSSPRRGRCPKLDFEEVSAFYSKIKLFKFAPILVHAPYVLNLCSGSEAHKEFVTKTLSCELKILDTFIPESYYVLHPGNHLGKGVSFGVKSCVDLLRKVVKQCSRTTILLETMSGKGTEICSNFSELAEIIREINSKRLAICFDSCHVFTSGYDIAKSVDNVLSEFDKILGLDKIKAVHLSDSKYECGSRKDRHELLGCGKIGLQPLVKLIQLLPSNCIYCLETPTTDDGHAREISLIVNTLAWGKF